MHHHEKLFTGSSFSDDRKIKYNIKRIIENFSLFSYLTPRRCRQVLSRQKNLTPFKYKNLHIQFG